jgi:hypothetical protein
VNYYRALIIVAVLSAGCGGRRSDRHPLTGAVTYQGRPVPSGQILFFSAETTNPLGVAVIKDGVYSTIDGRKPGLGPQVARLSLSDGVVSDMLPHGQPIAPEQQVEITLNAGETTKDFHLPQGEQVIPR